MTGQNHKTTTFDRVYDVILKRKQSSPETSYVAYLMDEGTDMILQKIYSQPDIFRTPQKVLKKLPLENLNSL